MFPALPTNRVQWLPIYLEPIIGSGERITACVVAIAENGDFIVEKSISRRVAKCVLSKHGVALDKLASECAHSLLSFLGSGKPITEWKPNFEGVFVGANKLILSPSLHKAAQAGLRASAFLSEAETAEEETDSGEKLTSGAERWIDLVRDAVYIKSAILADQFRRRVRLETEARETLFDFVGTKCASNLSRLIPDQKLASRVREAKSKLLDLETLRDYSARENLFGSALSTFQLVVYRPSDHDPSFTERDIDNSREAVAELLAHAKSQSLNIRPASSANEAAEHILEAEAA